MPCGEALPAHPMTERTAPLVKALIPGNHILGLPRRPGWPTLALKGKLESRGLIFVLIKLHIYNPLVEPLGHSLVALSLSFSFALGPVSEL